MLWIAALAWAGVEDGEPAAAETAIVSCEQPVSANDLARTLADATRAFAELDVVGFNSATELVDSAVPCLGEALQPLAVSDLYRVRSLQAFLMKDSEGMVDNLEAMRAAAPFARLPLSIAPVGHRLRDAFDAVDPDAEVATEAMPVPEQARLYIDGQPVLDRPTERPSLLQLVGTEGNVQWSALVEPQALPPTYPALADSFRDRYLDSVSMITVSERKPIALVVASAAMALGAGGMYGAAVVQQGKFESRETPDDKLPGLRASTNALVAGAAVSAAGAAGFGAVAAVSW